MSALKQIRREFYADMDAKMEEFLGNDAGNAGFAGNAGLAYIAYKKIEAAMRQPRLF